LIQVIADFRQLSNQFGVCFPADSPLFAVQFGGLIGGICHQLAQQIGNGNALRFGKSLPFSALLLGHFDVNPPVSIGRSHILFPTAQGL
jgi:hypothetical protein